MHNIDKPILRRIARLAEKEYRTFGHQLLAMTELYERTFGVSGKVNRKRRKVKAKPATQHEQPQRKRHGNFGRATSEETRKKMSESAIRRWAEIRNQQG